MDAITYSRWDWTWVMSVIRIVVYCLFSLSYIVQLLRLVLTNFPHTISTRSIWYLEKSGILNKSQCSLEKQCSTMDQLVSLERCVWDAFAQKQQTIDLFFNLEVAYVTTCKYGITGDLHGIGLRGRLPVSVSEYLRDCRIRVRIGYTLPYEFYPEEGVLTGGVLAITCMDWSLTRCPLVLRGTSLEHSLSMTWWSVSVGPA